MLEYCAPDSKCFDIQPTTTKYKCNKFCDLSQKKCVQVPRQNVSGTFLNFLRISVRKRLGKSRDQTQKNWQIMWEKYVFDKHNFNFIILSKSVKNNPPIFFTVSFFYVFFFNWFFDGLDFVWWKNHQALLSRITAKRSAWRMSIFPMSNY
jgi:hypothetical protein